MSQTFQDTNEKVEKATDLQAHNAFATHRLIILCDIVAGSSSRAFIYEKTYYNMDIRVFHEETSADSAVQCAERSAKSITIKKTCNLE